MELVLRDLTFACPKDGKHITVNLPNMSVISDLDPCACTDPAMREKAVFMAGLYYGFITKCEEESLAE